MQSWQNKLYIDRPRDLFFSRNIKTFLWVQKLKAPPEAHDSETNLPVSKQASIYNLTENTCPRVYIGKIEGRW